MGALGVVTPGGDPGVGGGVGGGVCKCRSAGRAHSRYSLFGGVPDMLTSLDMIDTCEVDKGLIKQLYQVHSKHTYT